MNMVADSDSTITPTIWDVVVVGGGLAGSVAAVRAAEGGASVLLVELADDPLGAGNTVMTSGSLNAAGVSPFTPPDELLTRVLEHGRADPALARVWAETCAPAVTWLTERGVAVAPDESGHYWLGDGSEVADAPNHVTSVGRAVIGRLRGELRARGGTVLCGMRVSSMEHDAEGLNWSLSGTDPAESVQGRAVILATGGFTANPDLLAAYLGPSSVSAKLRGARTNRGDGLLLALSAGADTVNTEYTYGHLLAYGALRFDRLWPYPRLDEVLPEAILVDRTGRRFVDEGLGDVAVTNTLARHPDPLGATLVFDAVTWRTRGAIRHHPRILPPNAAISRAAEGLHAAESAQLLSTVLGFDGDRLVTELETVNDWRRGTGAPPTVPRSGPAQRPIEGPLFGLRVVPGLSFTMGGIRIDEQGAVIDTERQRIPGLFAAGDAIGGLMGGARGGYHGGLMQAIVTGLLAGRSAAHTQHPAAAGEVHA